MLLTSLSFDSLEVKEVAERVIQGLQGHYVDLASDTIGFGFKLVRACLATPCGMCFGFVRTVPFSSSFTYFVIYTFSWGKGKGKGGM